MKALPAPYSSLPRYQGSTARIIDITEDIATYKKCILSCIELRAEEAQLQNTQSLLAAKRTELLEFSSKYLPG